MGWENLKIPMLVSSILLFAIALYFYLLRKWKFRARVGVYPFLHSLENMKVNSTILIRFDLPYRDEIKINILDGNEVIIDTISDEILEQGQHSVKFDTAILKTGEYYYQLISSRQNNIKRFEKV